MDFFSRQYAFKDGDPAVVIGEIGVNHNGDPALARKLIDVAADAGVHIAKFQVFKSEDEISRFAALAPYQRENAADAVNQLELCKALELSPSAMREMKAHCAARGIGFLCSVFDFGSVDFVADDLKVQALKVASGEVSNLPFLEYIGGKKVGVILSTGASTLEEAEAAVAALKRGGAPEIVVLHCVSNYPAPAQDLNLRAMATLRDRLKLPVGFSDHSTGIEMACAAVALGAVAIEKHFTLDRSMEGPDHAASIEPKELKQLVESVSAVHTALGDGIKRPMPSEMANLPLIRKGLVAKGPLKKGARLTRETIAIKRPADGIAPADIDRLVGRTLARDLADDEPITWEAVGGRA
jgi:N,N'-diacetyllegionaminate synthase